jgi:hypothetical protein
MIRPPGDPPHPWSEGLFIFPPDHPYRKIEEKYRAKYLREKESQPKELGSAMGPSSDQRVQGRPVLPKASS